MPDAHRELVGLDQVAFLAGLTVEEKVAVAACVGRIRAQAVHDGGLPGGGGALDELQHPEIVPGGVLLCRGGRRAGGEGEGNADGEGEQDVLNRRPGQFALQKPDSESPCGLSRSFSNARLRIWRIRSRVTPSSTPISSSVRSSPSSRP